MNFRKIIICVLLLNLFAFSLFAQRDAKAELEDEFGQINSGQIKARVDNFLNYLQSNPEAKGYVVGYGTQEAVSRVEKMIRDYLKTRNFPAERFEFVNRRTTDELKIQFWLVPAGAKLPGAERDQEKQPDTVDSPQAQLHSRLENPNCEYHMAVMDSFFTELQNDPNATGYFITYANPRRVALSERQMRSYIKVRGVPPDRIVFLNGGGTRLNPTIEFWLVPPGAEPPVPSAPPADEKPESAEDVKEEPIDTTKPYIFSSEYYDGVVCYGEEDKMDLEGYAQILKENPKSRGNIVIMLTSKAEFRKKEKEILDYLTSKGIARKRLRTSYKNSFGGVELWILP